MKEILIFVGGYFGEGGHDIKSKTNFKHYGK